MTQKRNVVVCCDGTSNQLNGDLTSVKRYGTDANTVRLDAFVVSQDKETDNQAIATNEQRFAPNIKNVMSTDSLGDVLGGSVGEFMKFLPGVTVESDLADVSGVSIRGIGGGMTSITNDGAPASNIWTVPTATGAPSGRLAHTAVWTGAEMIVWGGADFVSGSTLSTDTIGALSPRLTMPQRRETREPAAPIRSRRPARP